MSAGNGEKEEEESEGKMSAGNGEKEEEESEGNRKRGGKGRGKE